MKTFNGNNKQKEELLIQLKHHQELDAFVQGSWISDKKIEGNGFKGCFYGCTMQTNIEAREKFSKKYSIDLWYCYVTEKIFEGLPKGEYQKFPVQSIEVLPVGIDLNKAKSLFNYKLLENQLQFCKEDKKIANVVKQCMELFTVPFNEISEAAARSARSAARSARAAAWSAWAAAESAESARAAARSARAAARSAWSAARSAEAAARSARSAARSAEAAAWSAARSAESAARSARSAESAESARAAAESNYYCFMMDLLFECIKT